MRWLNASRSSSLSERNTRTSSSTSRWRLRGGTARSTFHITPLASRCRWARSNSWLRASPLAPASATKPLASYSTDSSVEAFTVTFGPGVARMALTPCKAFSSASNTRLGRTLAGTTTLIDTPCTSAGRLWLSSRALAATELGITARLPVLVSRRVARQSISSTLPSVLSMEIESPI
ncbi:hypothetical protein D3C75_871740 [compost metagenome]